jgi:DNA repair photolyase
MHIREITIKRILTAQKQGFLTSGTHPYTHTLSWATGCGFGHTYCGAFCYAQKLPNWLYNKQDDEDWGDAVVVKTNAPEALHHELQRSRSRPQMRIFMSSVTDPYQPLERRYRLTRRCLEVFARFPDLDLLLVQTRSPLVLDDVAWLQAVPYAWLSMTLETDRADLPYGPNATVIEQRLAAVRRAADAGIPTQIVVSPCLPYSPRFAERLAVSGARRLVVDSFVAGDGSGGARTGSSSFATAADYDWRDEQGPHQLVGQLQALGVDVSWSAEGFAGIVRRTLV